MLFLSLPYLRVDTSCEDIHVDVSEHISCSGIQSDDAEFPHWRSLVAKTNVVAVIEVRNHA